MLYFGTIDVAFFHVKYPGQQANSALILHLTGEFDGMYWFMAVNSSAKANSGL
jgi:hypothetical protein